MIFFLDRLGLKKGYYSRQGKTTGSQFLQLVRSRNAPNKKVRCARFSIVGGVLLLVPGTQGPSGIYQLIMQELPRLTNDQAVLSVASIAIFALISLSSVGGLIVIFGGYLVLKNHVGTGKLLISLGGRIGIPWLIFVLYSLLTTENITAVLAQHSVVGWTGVLLTFLARLLA